MNRSDLEWLLRERDNLEPAYVAKIEAALAGDAVAWSTVAMTEAELAVAAAAWAELAEEHERIVAEIAADYAAERWAHEPYERGE